MSKGEVPGDQTLHRVRNPTSSLEASTLDAARLGCDSKTNFN